MNGSIDWCFETSQLRTRLINVGDRALYRALYTDPLVMAQVGPVMTEAGADAAFGKVLDYNLEWPVRARYWQLSDLASGTPAGLLSIVRAAANPDSVEPGLMLLPQWQGRGIGSELARKLVDILLENRWGLGTEALIVRNAASNVRVASMGVSFGFETPVSEGDAQEKRRLTRRAWLAKSSG